MGVPILGLCYGCQLTAQLLGGSVKSAPNKEFGKTETRFNNQSKVFGNLPESGITWMSHNDYVDAMPTGFTSVAQTDDCPVAAMENAERKIYCFQYHPEVNHTENGIKDPFVDVMHDKLIKFPRKARAHPARIDQSAKCRIIRQQSG